MGSIFGGDVPSTPAPVTRDDASEAARLERERQTRLRGLSSNILTDEKKEKINKGGVATKLLVGE